MEERVPARSDVRYSGHSYTCVGWLGLSRPGLSVGALGCSGWEDDVCWLASDARLACF